VEAKKMSKKVNVYGLDGEVKSDIELPAVFEVLPRFDLIRRAVVASESAEYQPQGRDPAAGKKNTAKGWGTGFAVARVPRLKGSGYPGARSAAFVSMAVGGRAGFAPSPNKIIVKVINKKERRSALSSAISATGMKELVEKRGHKMEKELSFPIVIDDKIQTLKRTKEVVEIFENMGIKADLNRVINGTKVRAGKGKMRGRKYRKPRGPLIVVKDDTGIVKAARSIPGVDVITVNTLSVRSLAPGSLAGRLTLWTSSAIKELKNAGGK
jgi:large subunit ribosomal protein L4e